MTMIIVIHILYFRIAVLTVYLQFTVMYFCLILKHTNSQSNSFADTCWSFTVSATKVLGSQHFCSFSMKHPNSWIITAFLQFQHESFIENTNSWITASFSPDMVDSRSGWRSTCKTSRECQRQYKGRWRSSQGWWAQVKTSRAQNHKYPDLVGVLSN